MHVSEPWRLGHRPALDGVRGVAVLLVVLAHAHPPWFPSSGAIGVTMFFALSGFLITSLLLDEFDTTGRIDLRAFYMRRAGRLFPALAVFLFVILLCELFISDRFGDPRDLIAVVFYVGNWLSATGNPMNQVDHTWSLAVEEQFYILFPLALIALLGRVTRRGILLAVLGVALASLSLRLAMIVGGATENRVYNGTDTAACLLLAGCVAAIAVRRWTPSRCRPGVAYVALGAAALLTFVPWHMGTRTIVPVLVAPLTVVAIVCLSGPHTRTWLEAGWLRLVGERSYALYLWHFPLLMLVKSVLIEGYGVPPLLATVVMVAASWWLAALSWRYVEQPVRQWVKTHPDIGVRLPFLQMDWRSAR